MTHEFRRHPSVAEIAKLTTRVRYWSVLAAFAGLGCSASHVAPTDVPMDAQADRVSDTSVDQPAPDAVRDAPPHDSGPACNSAADCVGTTLSSSWCGAGAGYSCINGTCLWECPPAGRVGRTCAIDANGCISCLGMAPQCPIECSDGNIYEAEVEGSSCVPNSSIPFRDLTIVRATTTDCRYFAYSTDETRPLGNIWRFNDEYLAYFPDYGGWCTARSAYSGAVRSIISCPSCQFTIVGFE